MLNSFFTGMCKGANSGFATSANRFLSDRDYGGGGGEAGAWRYRPNPEIMDLADLSGLSMGAYSDGGAR